MFHADYTNRPQRLLPLLAGAVFLAALALPGAQAQSVRIVASVNGEAILSTELQSEIDFLSEVQSGLSEDFLRQTALQSLINRKLQFQRGLSIGVQISDQEIDAAIGRLLDANGITLRQLLQAQGVNEDQLRTQVLTELTINEALRRDNRAELAMSPSLIDEELRSRLVRQHQLHEYLLEHAVLPSDNPELAQSLSSASGDDFAALAQAHTISEAGVRLGWQTKEQLPDDFVRQLETLSPGEVSEVMELANGLHVLHLIAVRPIVPGRMTTGQVKLQQLSVTGADPGEVQQVANEIIQGGLSFQKAAERLDASLEVLEFAPDELPPVVKQNLRLRVGEVGGPYEIEGGQAIVMVLGVEQRVEGDAQLRSQATQIASDSHIERVRRKWLEYLRSVGQVEIVSAAR